MKMWAGATRPLRRCRRVPLSLHPPYGTSLRSLAARVAVAIIGVVPSGAARGTQHVGGAGKGALRNVVARGGCEDLAFAYTSNGVTVDNTPPTVSGIPNDGSGADIQF